MVFSYGMATVNIRATFALDKVTKTGLGKLARQWSVSQSEALRRAVAASLRQVEQPNQGALEALARLRRPRKANVKRDNPDTELKAGWQSWADRLQDANPKGTRARSGKS